MSVQWPQKLTLVRHGQSAGNLAAEKAERLGISQISIDFRDVDVPLSPLGERQAKALAHWLAVQPRSQWPTVILSSPYLRAMNTAQAIQNELSEAKIEIIPDERLRERELGIIDRFTKKGITEKYPYQAELHSRLGKFYYRPPGGESWCDVILRLRSVNEALARDFAGQNVLICGHAVVIMGFRYLLEKLNEAQLLQIDRDLPVANCGLTTYSFPRDEKGIVQPYLERFNYVAPLEEAGEKVTRQEDRQDLPK